MTLYTSDIVYTSMHFNLLVLLLSYDLRYHRLITYIVLYFYFCHLSQLLLILIRIVIIKELVMSLLSNHTRILIVDNMNVKHLHNKANLTMIATLILY